MLEKVEIRYGIVKNTRGADTGWVPWWTSPVKLRKSSWDARYLTAEEALQEAKAGAEEEAARYTGDWDIRLIEE